MNFSIITKYPIWLILFCILLALAYSIVLYRKDNKLNELSKSWIYLLGSFRFITVFILSLLLLSPLIKSISKTTENPVLIIAQDNSESILINKDSVFYKNEYSKKLSEMIRNLAEKYEVNTFTFGDKAEKSSLFKFTDKQTDFSELLNTVYSKYSNRNIGALVIASDGIYNKGANPVYTSSILNIPIYTIALGDTNIQKDLIISQVKVNKIAFLGNKFPVKVFITIKELKGIKTKLSLLRDNKEIFSKEVFVNSDIFTEIVDIETDADKIGIQHYIVKLEPVKDEISYKNNVKNFIVDIIENKQKVLILLNSPHPDAGAIKDAMRNNKNFEVDLFTIEKFNGNIKNYNLVVLHQLPSFTNAATTYLTDIFKFQVPVLFILGSQSNINNLNNLKSGLSIKQLSQAFNDAQPIYNQQFALFEADDEMQTFFSDAPPLLVPFGDYSVGANTEIFYSQKIRNIMTKMPLIFFRPEGAGNDNKTGFIAGEGIWRWRLYDAKIHSTHELFNELINKIIQYMSLRVKKDNFTVYYKNVFNENEALIFNAEVYNESFELITSAIVDIDIFDKENKKFNFSFTPDISGDKTFNLNTGVFPIGDYTFMAKAKIGDKEYKKMGKFAVIPIDIEAENTVANHQLLYQLSKAHNGKMFYPNELDKLQDEITSNKEIVPVSYFDKNLQDIINLKLIFILVLLLLSVEWFLRKYYGSY